MNYKNWFTVPTHFNGAFIHLYTLKYDKIYKILIYKSNLEKIICSNIFYKQLYENITLTDSTEFTEHGFVFENQYVPFYTQHSILFTNEKYNEIISKLSKQIRLEKIKTLTI